MENFRDFQAGPDPFGRTWRALFKYLQTGISIRHSDTVDVGYVLENAGESIRKTVVLHHAEVRAYSQRSGRLISDTWCSRVAAHKLLHVVSSADDLEKDYLAVTPKELEEYDSAIQKWEKEWVKTHHAS